MNKLNKFFRFNPIFKKNKHPKDEAPVEDVNEQPPENANENIISSGSGNTKNTLSSGSSQKTGSLNPDETNNDTNINFKMKALSRATPPRSTAQSRRTYAPASFNQEVSYNSNNTNNFSTNNAQIKFKSQFANINDYNNEVSETDILSIFQNSFSERITINLPLDELNASSLRADVLLSMVKDKAQNLDKSVTDTEKKVEEVSNQMKSIINKSRSITQTATVINAKLVNIDEWIDRIGTDKSDFKISIVEFFVSIFSILTTILSLMWFSLRRRSVKGKKSI